MLRLALVVLCTASAASSQPFPDAARTVLGDWTVVDEATGEAQAVVRITAAGAGIEGRIVRVLPTRAHPQPSPICATCRGRYRDTDLRRALLIHGMTWDGRRFAGGRVVDPQGNREYRATITPDGPDRLRLRGYVGIPALGRTQIWTRAR